MIKALFLSIFSRTGFDLATIVGVDGGSIGDICLVSICMTYLAAPSAGARRISHLPTPSVASPID